MITFAGGKFCENVGKTFHVGVIFTIFHLFPLKNLLGFTRKIPPCENFHVYSTCTCWTAGPKFLSLMSSFDHSLDRSLCVRLVFKVPMPPLVITPGVFWPAYGDIDGVEALWWRPSCPLRSNDTALFVLKPLGWYSPRYCTGESDLMAGEPDRITWDTGIPALLSKLRSEVPVTLEVVDTPELVELEVMTIRFRLAEAKSAKLILLAPVLGSVDTRLAISWPDEDFTKSAKFKLCDEEVVALDTRLLNAPNWLVLLGVFVTKLPIFSVVVFEFFASPIAPAAEAGSLIALVVCLFPTRVILMIFCSSGNCESSTLRGGKFNCAIGIFLQRGCWNTYDSGWWRWSVNGRDPALGVGAVCTAYCKKEKQVVSVKNHGKQPKIAHWK